MNEITTERRGAILRIELNRPQKKNAMRSSSIGTTLLPHCDFVYAGESAKFQLPFVDLGLVPEFGSTWSIPARVGYHRAADLMPLGLPLDAKRDADGILREAPAELHVRRGPAEQTLRAQQRSRS